MAIVNAVCIGSGETISMAPPTVMVGMNVVNDDDDDITALKKDDAVVVITSAGNCDAMFGSININIL